MSSIYLHGTTASEQQRLSQLNAFINDACLAEMRLRGNERILDVGAGLMQFSRAMARSLGSTGHVIAVERDPEQRAEAMRQANEAGEDDLVEVREGDAYSLPLRSNECGLFDIVHARFILEHLSNPLRAVREMMRATRPGGRIILADDDHDTLRFWPRCTPLENLWNAYVETYARHGNDPAIGRKLIALLHEAGAQPVRNTHIFFGGCAGDPIFPAVMRNLAGLFESARASMIEFGLMSAREIDDGLAAHAEWARRPDASMWYAICWAEGRRPLAVSR